MRPWRTRNNPDADGYGRSFDEALVTTTPYTLGGEETHKAGTVREGKGYMICRFGPNRYRKEARTNLQPNSLFPSH